MIVKQGFLGITENGKYLYCDSRQTHTGSRPYFSLVENIQHATIFTDPIKTPEVSIYVDDFSSYKTKVTFVPAYSEHVIKVGVHESQIDSAIAEAN